MQFVDGRLDYFHANEVSKCKLFALTLIESTRLWFNALTDRSIESWTYLYRNFCVHFVARKRKLVTVVALSEITQGKNESL